jgi:hypothetical protein
MRGATIQLAGLSHHEIATRLRAINYWNAFCLFIITMDHHDRTRHTEARPHRSAAARRSLTAQRFRVILA